jgi:hypothetical protein
MFFTLEDKLRPLMINLMTPEWIEQKEAVHGEMDMRTFTFALMRDVAATPEWDALMGELKSSPAAMAEAFAEYQGAVRELEGKMSWDDLVAMMANEGIEIQEVKELYEELDISFFNEWLEWGEMHLTTKH